MSTLEIMKHQKVMLKEEDRHEHDCSNCDYIGSYAVPVGDEYKHVDLYVCENGAMTGLAGNSNAVIRHGDAGREYTSQPLTLLYRDETKVPRWQRAKEYLRRHIRVEYDPMESRVEAELSLEETH